MYRRTAIPIAILSAAWLLTAAWLYRGLFMDDAYIGFHYVANLLAGHGFVFNSPARVEGVTNTGWLLVLAPLATFLGPLLAAKWAGGALLALTIALTAKAAPSARIAALATLTTAFHAELVGFSLLGMETALLAALVMAMVVLAERQQWGWLPALGTLAFLTHPEAGLVAPLGLILSWRTGALPLRTAFRSAAACALGIAAVTLVRWLYFGALLPNTFAAKPAVAAVVRQNLSDFVIGASTNVSFPFAGLFALPFVVMGWRSLRRTAPLTASFSAAAGLAGLAFALYARPDWTELARYFAPYAPCAYLLLWAGLFGAEETVLAGRSRIRKAGWIFTALAVSGGVCALILMDWETETQQAASFLWIVLALLWVMATETSRALGRKAGLATTVLAVFIAAYGAFAAIRYTANRSFPGYIITSRTLIEPTLWIRDHLPPGDILATRRIGALAYFSGHPVFDYCFGLTEPAVARRIHERGEAFNYPCDSKLAALWRERSPDYILEDGAVLADIAKTAGGTPEKFRIHGFEYGVVHRFRIAPGVDWTLAGRR